MNTAKEIIAQMKFAGQSTILSAETRAIATILDRIRNDMAELSKKFTREDCE